MKPYDVNGDALVVYTELDGKEGMVMRKPGELKNNDTPYDNRGWCVAERGWASKKSSYTNRTDYWMSASWAISSAV